MYKIQIPDPAGSESDKNKLVAFVGQLEALLSDIVRTGQDSVGRPFIIKELRRSMKKAWNGSSKVDGAPARFEAVRKAINDADEATLATHGLVGPMLAFKLTVLHYWAERYNLLGGFRWYDKLLDMIDTLFDSILEALKLDGALKELKEFIRSAADEG